MNRIFFLLLIIVTIYGCEKDNSVYDSSSLIGEWKWLISCGGIVGCVEPSENNTGSLLFTIDSILYTYRNDTLYSSKTFHTYKKISDDSLDTLNIITYGSATQEYSIDNDILLFLNRSLKFYSRYKRIKQEHIP